MKNKQKICFYILIFIGIASRVFSLLYYYFLSDVSPLGIYSFGDVHLNFYDVDSILTGEWIWNDMELAYPPLSIYFLLILRFLSFNNLYVFFFYSFLVEIIASFLFYFVLKKFRIPNYQIIFGFFLLNPFYYFSYVFRGIQSGYRITDSFFNIFLLLALYYYNKENKSLFYIFSALSSCVKWYTLPLLFFIFLKHLLEKDWNQMKKFIIYSGVPIFIFLLSPIFYLPNYLDLYLSWLSGHSITSSIPFYVKIIPFVILLIIFTFKIKKFDFIDLIFISIILMVTIIWWSRFYIRYLAPLIYYGHINTNESLFSFKMEVSDKQWNFSLNKHSLTFIISILAAGFVILIAILDYAYWGLPFLW
ncbi:MAG: hypothetical protein EU547_06335 [Promethearchaeota archaeon]|nr:MAG: hypothetical protein EU547_06335 [Candidatus Lokiarchaeota archaeon]